MKLYSEGEQLKRIADALELVIQMVKKDQEETRARFEERWDEPKVRENPESIQTKWAVVPGQQWPAFTCSTGDGSWIRDQATSIKRQAASAKLQAWQGTCIVLQYPIN